MYRPDDPLPYAERVRAPRDRIVVHAARSVEEAAALIRDAEILFTWRFPRELYGDARRLRWAHAMAAGVDWLLVPELPAGVTVTRTEGVYGPWMAEYVVGWCAWVAQGMEGYRVAQRAHRWSAGLPAPLHGRTMCIVGLGDIGRAIARAARALGMRVTGVSRSGRAVPRVDRVWRLRDLRRALADADFVVVVVPLTAETRGLIGEAELHALRPTAWLVNVARGAVVDERALTRALDERRLAGAVLDVFDTEPLPPAHPFWPRENVVVTPHIAGPDYPDELTAVFNENLTRYLAGGRLRHVVDRRRGY
ncbi:MAG: D-2-hydroxyacid dehydrogenase [Candidatus Rokubacteria bacterium]|nr:D-2-hydroxyacid dehydrogenase [Candidatus Rokubacteria bacterium]